MELINHTVFPALLFRGVIDEERFIASVLVRVTYDIVGNRLIPSSDQAWKVSAAPWQSEYGLMDSDEVFYKGGVDFFVFGQVCTPQGKEMNRMDISIEVADFFQRKISVFGDRVWLKRDGKLVPSEPSTFRAMPLSLENAFGGKDQWDGLDVPFPDNPDGKGFYIEEENAVGKPLPNIENPDYLITKWDDKPPPVGLTLCPMQNGLRLRSNLKFNEEAELEELNPRFFNNAFPDMILDRLAPGMNVRLSGVLSSGPLVFAVPSTEFICRLQFDEEIIEQNLFIDQIGIEVDKQRAFISYRYPFRYVFHPMQRRSCELCLIK